MKIYVDIRADREGDGSKSRPFKYINAAAKVAKAGDEVLVAPGIYRESVDPVNPGLENEPIIYKSTEPLGAIITGAEEASKWKKYKGTVWSYRIKNGVFGDYNPYTTFIGGDWYFAPKIRHTGAVYLNGRQLYEAASLEDCIKGEVYAPSWEPQYSIYQWYTTQEEDETVIYANFQDVDPNKEHVEINVRRNCFMPSKIGVNYITLSGFNVNKAATTWAPPAAYQDGMIGPHWSKGWIIEDCEISNSKCSGISLGKYYDPENDHYFSTKHVKSPAQMERDAVCRGQYHGWAKANIGSHIVRRCHIHHCEQTGIVGRMGCVFSIIEDNHIHNINNMQQLGGAEIAAIKLHAAIDVTLQRNHIHNSTMGIWLDWEAQGTRVSKNLLHDNMTPEGTPEAMGGMSNQDLFIEISHGPTLIDNNIMLSEKSARLSCQGNALIHNLMLGAVTGVGSGADMVIDGAIERRYTPYHIRHETAVAGFMTMLHGDTRIYNNIFVQNWPVKEAEVKEDMGFMTVNNQIAGTSVYDDFPDYDEWVKPFDLEGEANMLTMRDYHYKKLPVWINGNAYFNGAKPWNREVDKYVRQNDSEVFVKLEVNNGKYSIKTNIYDLLSEFCTGIITTEDLGQAFEPEQKFENPDGTSITFDTDYFGEHRGTSTIPGPFASAKEASKSIW